METTFRNGKLYGTLWERPERSGGTVEIRRNNDGKIVVIRSETNHRPEEIITGFRNFKHALEEAECYA